VAVTVGTLVGGLAAPGWVCGAGGAAGTEAGSGGSLLAHAASKRGKVQRNRNSHRSRPAPGPKMKLCADDGKRHMLLILLEALLAGAILVFIVWWTMFSGRRDGERRDEE